MGFQVPRGNRFGLWSLIGKIMAMDDGSDFGQLDRVHHWLLGLVVMSGAEVLNLIAIIRELNAIAQNGG